MKQIILLIIVYCLGVTITRAQWISQDAGFTTQNLGFFEISIVDENVVWAICYDGVGGLFGPKHILDFTRTTDGGTTWIPGVLGTDSTLAFSTICALSDTEAWVAMHKFDFSGGGGLFHTTDGGITWDQSPGAFTATSFPNFVYFKDELNGVAGGDATDGYFEIYTTIDGGDSWTRTPEANIPAFITGTGYGWFDGFDVVGDTVWFGTYGGVMYKSTDFGLTWTVSPVSPDGYMVYEIAFNDDGQHALSHIRSNVATFLFSTSDGGATWTQLPFNSDWKQSKITSVPGTNTYVSTSVIAFNQGSSYTKDLGVTWTEIEQATPKAACRFLNGTTGWAGGYFNPGSDGIYKWDESSTVLPIMETVQDENNLNIYPNPASDFININFSFKYLRFYNAVGMLVKEVNNSNATEINIKDLPGGIYFIQIDNETEVNMKLVINR